MYPAAYSFDNEIKSFLEVSPGLGGRLLPVQSGVHGGAVRVGLDVLQMALAPRETQAPAGHRSGGVLRHRRFFRFSVTAFISIIRRRGRFVIIIE